MAFAVTARVQDRFLVNGNDGIGGRFQIAPGSVFPDQSIVLSAGATTGPNTINKAYAGQFLLTAGATTSIDLTACTWAGTLQAFTAVRYLQVDVQATTTVDTNPVVTFGPMGVANGAVLCFGATTGSQQVRKKYENSYPALGWGVTASNKVVQLRNDGATYGVTASFLALGIG